MSQLSYYINSFHLFNILLCLVYPIIRNYGQTLMLNVTDTWGFKRETQIITSIIIILILRYVKSYSSFKKYIHEVFFYFKCGIIILTLFIDYKLCCWYVFSCLIVWVLFKPPQYTGPSNVQYIPNEVAFNEIVLSPGKKGKDNAWFIVFYSFYSNDCIYTEELFALMSMKYTTQSLHFGKVDVDANQSLANKYWIKTSGFKINLPYVIMFINGKEDERYPGNDKEGKPLQVRYYREKEIARIFNLNEIYNATK